MTDAQTELEMLEYDLERLATSRDQPYYAQAIESLGGDIIDGEAIRVAKQFARTALNEWTYALEEAERDERFLELHGVVSDKVDRFFADQPHEISWVIVGEQSYMIFESGTDDTMLEDHVIDELEAARGEWMHIFGRPFDLDGEGMTIQEIIRSGVMPEDLDDSLWHEIIAAYYRVFHEREEPIEDIARRRFVQNDITNNPSFELRLGSIYDVHSKLFINTDIATKAYHFSFQPNTSQDAELENPDTETGQELAKRRQLFQEEITDLLFDRDAVVVLETA